LIIIGNDYVATNRDLLTIVGKIRVAGYELGITREYSITVPFAGDILPIWFIEFSVNQRLPSGPAVIA
jgi:hypothetical protein